MLGSERFMAGTKMMVMMGAVAGVLMLAGCGEVPQPAEDNGSQKPAARAKSAEQKPAGDPIPAKPPVQSEPEPAGGSAYRAVTPAELQALIAQNKGKLVLVDFWATWCVPCRQQFPHTVELSKKHATDLVVYAVSMDAKDKKFQATVGKVYEEHSSGNVVPFVSANGGSGEAFEGFEITGGALPHYKLYGRDGKLIETFSSGNAEDPFTPSDIDKAIATALKG